MHKESVSRPQLDEILTIVGWIKEYCEQMHNEIIKKKWRVDGFTARYHIGQWTESIATFTAQTTELPCPSCQGSIPLQLDKKLLAEIIISILKDKFKHIEIDSDFVKNKIAESAGEHLIPCKGHNKDCAFSAKGWIALSDLLPFFQ